MRANTNRLTIPPGRPNLSLMLPKDTTGVPAIARMPKWLIGDRTQGWLAQVLPVARPTVYRWCQGEHVPEPHQRRAIHDLSKGYVHFDDWYTEDEIRAAYAHSRTLGRRLKRREQIRKEDT